jgi:hypothetical protein
VSKTCRASRTLKGARAGREAGLGRQAAAHPPFSLSIPACAAVATGPPSQRRTPGRAASARALRAQAQADPHGLLALAAAAAGARLREEPLRGGR